MEKKQSLFIEADEVDYYYDFPEIRFDTFTGVFEISAYANCAYKTGVYEPLFKWLEDYIKHPAGKTSLIFNLLGLDCGDDKAMLEIIRILQKTPNFNVIWRFHEDDKIIRETGKKLATQTSIPFEFQKYN